MRTLRLLGVGSLLLAGAALASAASPVAPPEAPTEPRALAAYRVLETHCARCHQEGRLNRLAPAAAFGNILRLPEIADDPHLLHPGNPDASRLYLKMLTREMPRDVLLEGVAGEKPTATEIAAVRAWIISLPRAPERTCAPHSGLSETEAALAMAADLAEAGPEVARDSRYLTLTHFANACLPEATLATWRTGTEIVLNAASESAQPSRLVAVDRAGAVLRVRLSELGWSADNWQRLARLSPYAGLLDGTEYDPVRTATGDLTPVMRADWLAFLLAEGTQTRLNSAKPLPPEAVDAVVTAGRNRQGLAQLARQSSTQFTQRLAEAGIDTQAVVDGAAAGEALARAYRKDVRTIAGAAELGLEPAVLMHRLAGAPLDLRLLRDRLEQGDLTRAEFEAAFPRLLAATRLRGTPATAPRFGVASLDALEPEATRPFAFALVASHRTAKPRDVLTLTLQSERDCDLTIVSIDGTGRAIVLLPNDFDRNTRLLAGRMTEFPRDGAAFRFRHGKPGIETIIAICNSARAQTDGIRHDFNLQKFTDLGPYEAYLERWLKGEPSAQTQTTASRRRVPRRRAREPASVAPAPAAAVVLPAAIQRRAIQIVVREP